MSKPNTADAAEMSEERLDNIRFNARDLEREGWITTSKEIRDMLAYIDYLRAERCIVSAVRAAMEHLDDTRIAEIVRLHKLIVDFSTAYQAEDMQALIVAERALIAEAVKP